jgi:hypothetical protein
MRQTARRKRAVLPGRSLREAPFHNPDGVAARGMRAAPGHSLSEKLCRTRVDLLAAPRANQRSRQLFAGYLAHNLPNDCSIVET